ncbi:MAG TPA: hypothetical protein VGG29_05555 [Caulobacteraceae bacterium]|jgi:hypothetical protein
MSWAGLGPFLSLDNIFVALALAPFCPSRAAFVRLIAWFAGVEAAAPALGAVLRVAFPQAGWTSVAPSALLLTLGFAVLGAAAIRRWRGASRVAEARARPAGVADPAWWAAGGLPTGALAVLLGLDNLVAGASLPLAEAAGCGLLSGATVLAAGLAARAAGRFAPPPVRIVAAGLLLAAAGVAGLAT